MRQFGINKGVGRSAEFKGLTAQYLLIFAGGLLAVFVLVALMFMAGANSFACVCTGIVTGGGVTAIVFRLNSKYGVYGLMKLAALSRHPRRIVSRRPVARLIKRR